MAKKKKVRTGVHHIKSVKKNRMKFRVIGIFVFLLLIFLMYLMYVTSYILNIDNASFNTLYTQFLYRFIHPYPFKFTFHLFSLLWLLVFLLCYTIWLAGNIKPKGDSEWEGIEQGSNHFMNDDELTEFLQKKSDDIIDFSDIEVKDIEIYDRESKNEKKI